MANPTNEAMEEDDYIDIDDTGPEGLKGADGEEYKRSWDVIQEDASGSIQSSITDLNSQRSRKRRQQRSTETLQRGIIRHVVLVIDQSENMSTRDLMPSRIQATLALLEQFVGEFFDQNPISQLALVATKDGLAEKLTDLSGNPRDHLGALRDKASGDLAGEPRAPAHGSREIVCVFGSLTTCDPGDIEQTLRALQAAEVRVSMVHLAAEVHVFRRICQSTAGVFAVAVDEDHMRESLFENIPPPALVKERATADMVQMGFPVKAQMGEVPSPCVCHHELRFAGFLCPRCGAKVCGLPTDCDVCGLALVSAPHLARSYRHLFPEENFREAGKRAAGAVVVCFGCGAKDAGFECVGCRQAFCLECDVFVHETLHNCPGCV
ncbi:Ssl1-like-domain-containing protein [Kickxella alabastrina]|uniref:Ssl1-like-domain-containing protein n=1 Tax=Kickxella alabastrina TaxID=61397 RepID=UPI0022205BFE|nr:Ssl1-like-domain-containing protein [Kickxella alabastrina]KAI7833941.1 Ssl1-like-domain-containing protein [Kickxella alabastrina]